MVHWLIEFVLFKDAGYIDDIQGFIFAYLNKTNRFLKSFDLFVVCANQLRVS